MQRVSLFVAVLLALPGCASLQDWHYDRMNGLRAEMAWARSAGNPVRVVCPADYGDGWKHGYLCKINGGTGQPPTLPPEKFWSSSYQNPRGQEAIAAWYSGFNDGVAAASQSCAGQYHYLRPYAGPPPVQGGTIEHLPPRREPQSLPPTGIPLPSSAFSPEPPADLLLPTPSQGAVRTEPVNAPSQPILPSQANPPFQSSVPSQFGANARAAIEAEPLDAPPAGNSFEPTIERLPPMSETPVAPAIPAYNPAASYDPTSQSRSTPSGR